MRIVRYAAVAVTALMSLMNLPAAFDKGDLPTAVAVIGTVVGALGLVAAVALARRAAFGVPATVAVGVVNLAGGVAAVAQDWAGGGIGIALSLAVCVLGLMCRFEGSRHAAVAA